VAKVKADRPLSKQTRAQSQTDENFSDRNQNILSEIDSLSLANANTQGNVVRAKSNSKAKPLFDPRQPENYSSHGDENWHGL
jgi:hypothetical protein